MITRLAISGLRLAAAARKRRALAPDTVTSVVLIELTGLGDVISMLPVLRGFRSLFPRAELHLVVDQTLVEFLQAIRLPATVHGVRSSKTAWGAMAAVQLVRNICPTLVCSMSPPRRNAFVALASGVHYVAGYLGYTDSLTPYLLQTPVESFGMPQAAPASYGREHISERSLKVCQALGLAAAVPTPPLSIEVSTAERVKFDLLLAGLLPRDGYIVLHPFAGWKARQWPLQEFVTLAHRFLDASTDSIIFLWEREKEGGLEEVQRHFAGERRVLFASTLRLLETAVLVSGADLFVGNDSGPLHLASALATPVVGLFGPSEPNLTAPRSDGQAIWLYKGTECSPCDQRSCARPGNPCMNEISVEEVLTASVSVQRRLAHV